MTRQDKTASRLIATAAPAMLSALESVNEWCDLIEQNYPEMRFPKEVRSAIAKAKGLPHV